MVPSPHIRLRLVEFYITNVCNLTCQGCNRFNNYKFSGYQKWDDYKDIYTTWSQQINPSAIGILGGEPLLNPDYMQWLLGIRQLWPRSSITTTTNGYQLNRVNGLYEFHLLNKKNTFLSIGIHNKKSKKLILDNIKKFLVGPLEYKFNSDNVYQQYMIIKDSNQVSVKVEYNWWFHQGALIQNPESSKFTLHTSDVKKAHDICHSKTCHHFMHGKLYKCGAVALFPEFAQQHEIVLSPEDQALMLGYQPLQVTDSLEVKKEFVKNLSNPIPQCRFCPEEYHGKQIFAEPKSQAKKELL